MKRAVRTWHRLYESGLTDCPGRYEVWVEDLRYLGNGAWELRMERQNQIVPERAFRDRLSTRSLIKRILEEDAYLTEGSEVQGDRESDAPRELGPKAEALYAIAQQEGAAYCIACLDGWLVGTWPPPRKLPNVRIHGIIGPGARPVWFHVQHRGVLVDTNLGQGFLYPLILNGFARFVYPPIAGPNANIRLVKVPRRFLAELEACGCAVERDLSCRC